MLTDTQKKALREKLDPTHVKTREQAGQTLSYIEAWRVIDVANSIFGFDGWTRETVEMQEVRPAEFIKQEKTGRNGPYTAEQWRVGFMAKVRIVVGTVVREGTGFGSGISKQLEDAYESAVKEAESDAMKRAMMTFGNPFGLALYDKTQANVGVDEPAPEKAPARATPPANANSGPLTPAGRQRRAGERLTDANDVQTIMEALLANVAKKGDPDSLKKWATGQRAQIASLPDKAFDEFMNAYERTMDELVAGRVFA